MITQETLTVVLVTLMPVIVCDYQLEVNLISYNNPERRLQNGQCCDLGGTGNCFPQDTCDVRFTFSVQNFNTLVTFHLQTKVVGTYENTDMITFANCSTLMGNERNPLKFVIPSNQWTAGQTIRVQMAIADVDINPTAGTMRTETILGTIPIVEILRPSAPSSIFTTENYNGVNSLTLSFQYRVICTSGTCGSNCSQTINCQPFPPECVPMTCADEPCQNGGTCSDVQGGYTCQCQTHCNDPPNCATCTNPCSGANPCLNGGACVAQGNSFTCNCRQGYEGTRCQAIQTLSSTVTLNMPDITTGDNTGTTSASSGTSMGAGATDHTPGPVSTWSSNGVPPVQLPVALFLLIGLLSFIGGLN